MLKVYMMYRLLDKTYCVGTLFDGRVEAVLIDKIVNQEVVQRYRDSVPLIPAFTLKSLFTIKFEKP